MSGEAAMAESGERRCPGTNLDGSPCGTDAALLGPSGWCFAHDPEKQTERKAASTLGGLQTGKRMRKGIDVGKLDTATDAKRILARLATALASGELPAPAGRAALVAVKEWLHAHDVEETEKLNRRLEEEQGA